jgi:glycosyltransferase involved in cell wall biosynthesis
MRIGIVAYWFNRGQAIVARQIRATLDGLGHETFVLARPTRKTNIKPGWVETEGVWAQAEVTAASDYLIPAAEYMAWAEAVSPDLVLFDQNYQFDEIAQLRESGVRTIGRFVWEHFSAEHVEPARRAFDRIYSLTASERDRYAELGIDSPRVRWGCFPELVEMGQATGAEAAGTGREAEDSGGVASTGREAEDSPGVVSFYFPGSFLGRRKPIRKVLKAFAKADGEHLRLLVNAQVPRNDETLREAAAADPRIELMLEDEPEAAHRARFAACDVCLAPSRWEGLGLPLYEATAFGMPIITNDKPPMSEMVLDGRSGVLVASTQNGTARSGIPAWDPDVAALTAAIERLGDRAELERMRAGVAELAAERAWSRTTADLAALVGG